jgi:ATP-binding cassette subfamily C (CFTR/MRP) protein 1
LSWHTENPDLTSCFQKTVLVWTPCIFLWTFSSLEAYYLLNSKRKNIPHTWLFIAKFILTVALILLTFMDLGKAVKDYWSDITVYSVDYCTPCIKIVTFVSNFFIICTKMYLSYLASVFVKRFQIMFDL